MTLIPDRLRTLWPSLSARAKAAILILLGAGGVGTGVVVVDRNRPPPVVVDPAPPRPPPTDPGTRPPPVAGDYPLIGSNWTSDWDMHRLKPVTTGIAFTATGPTSGIGGMIALADYGQPPHVGYVVRDCSFQTAPGAKRKWDMRIYDAVGWTIERSTFKGWHEEHHIYADVPSSITIQDCKFGDADPKTVDGMGAGIQMAFRKNGQYESESGDETLVLVKGTQIIRRCEFNYIGHPDSPRFPAFTLSLHHAEVDWNGLKTGRINSGVVLEDLILRGGHLSHAPGTKWHGTDSPMGIMVQDRPSLTMNRVRLEYPKPANNWALQAWFIDDVLIEDCHFESGRIEFKSCGKVTVRNCTGNATIYIGEGAFSPATMPVTLWSGPVAGGVEWAAAVVK